MSFRTERALELHILRAESKRIEKIGVTASWKPSGKMADATEVEHSKVTVSQASN